MNFNDYLPVVLNKKIHKDIITDIDNFKQTLISTLSTNGYLKIFCLENLILKAKLCIRYPLP